MTDDTTTCGLDVDGTVLAQAGWIRRTVTDQTRANELVDLYRGCGFETRLIAINEDQVALTCQACMVGAGECVALFTRPIDQSPSFTSHRSNRHPMDRHFASKPAESFSFRDILYEKKNFVARITINRPESYNCYRTATLEELITAFDDASADDQVAVIVFTGAGDKAFCTGGDVKEYASLYTQRPRDYFKYMGLFSKYLESILRTGKVVIARINGAAVGGGNESQLACDLAVMADDTYLGQVGTSVGSVAAGGATQWLSLHVGDRRAREMLFLNPRIPAAKALEWGLVNRVVPRAKLDAEVDSLVEQLLDKFPECTRYTKAQVNYWKEASWYATVGHARDWLSTHFTTLEPYEGMQAFVEKRKADYRGLRRKAAEGASSEFLWGPYRHACGQCGAAGLPADFQFCGKCGSALVG